MNEEMFQNLCYSMEQQIKEGIARAKDEDMEIHTDEADVEKTFAVIHAMTAGNEELRQALLRYCDACDLREYGRTEFGVKLGIELTLRLLGKIGMF